MLSIVLVLIGKEGGWKGPIGVKVTIPILRRTESKKAEKAMGIMGYSNKTTQNT